MRRYLWFVFPLLLTAACNKSSSVPYITGDWEISEVDGGLAGRINYPPGNGSGIRFDADGRFIVTSVGNQRTIRDSGTYSLMWTANRADLLFLTFKQDLLVTDSVRVASDKLFISRPYSCCDMPYLEIYNRKP